MSSDVIEGVEMIINTKNYIVHGFFVPNKFGYRSFKGRPCTTRWLYDWMLDLGPIVIFKKAQ